MGDASPRRKLGKQLRLESEMTHILDPHRV